MGRWSGKHEERGRQFSGHPRPRLGQVVIKLAQRALFSTFICTSLLLSLAACGVPSGTSHSTNTNPRQLTYPERVEQVSWKWEVPENFQIVDIIPVPVGVAVLLDDGFVVLAGDIGEEVWEYRAGERARTAYA